MDANLYSYARCIPSTAALVGAAITRASCPTSPRSYRASPPEPEQGGRGGVGQGWKVGGAGLSEHVASPDIRKLG